MLGERRDDHQIGIDRGLLHRRMHTPGPFRFLEKKSSACVLQSPRESPMRAKLERGQVLLERLDAFGGHGVARFGSDQHEMIGRRRRA